MHPPETFTLQQQEFYWVCQFAHRFHLEPTFISDHMYRLASEGMLMREIAEVVIYLLSAHEQHSIDRGQKS